MWSGKGTPGNRTTGNGNNGRSATPRTLSVASLIFFWAVREGLWQRGEQKSVAQTKCGPRGVLGNRREGPSSTPSDEEGFTYGAGRTPKGVASGSSKNVSEQLQPVYRRQLANTCQHVLEFERLWEKAVGACGETLVAHFGRAV